MKEGRKEGNKEGRKEGGKEGRGRQEKPFLSSLTVTMIKE